MSEQIVLDYSHMMAPNLGGRGIRPEQLHAAEERFPMLHAAVEKRRVSGELAFFRLPDQRKDIEQILDLAQSLEGQVDNVVILGIGGSALGAIALREALLPAGWNELGAEARGQRPRIHVLDNVDPTTIGPLLERLDLRRTLFNVVSKSGTTAETMAQFLIVNDRLRAVLGDDAYRRHLVFTTDPDDGVLRRLAQEESIAALDIPPGVGGRFSVLSAVGLFPAALVGMDIRELLSGAAEMVQRCATARLDENPAGLFATLQHAADTLAGAPMHVMMAYSDRLHPIADWFRQLWAESLGKRVDRDGNEVFRGPTPLKALGATDQHSQVQLYMEGPYDKTITFLRLRDLDADLTIPRLYGEIEALAYLGGHTLGELLDAEYTATAQALAREGRMNMTLELPDRSARTIGQLLMLLQIATVYAGEIYEVNPMDQPGVELGKRLTYALMGRSGYEAPGPTTPSQPWRCE